MHRVWNTATDQMQTLPGSFQASGLWITSPGMPGALMEPVEWSYTYSPPLLPEGEYEFKAALRGSDNENSVKMVP